MDVDVMAIEVHTDSHFSPRFSQNLIDSLVDNSEQRLLDNNVQETIIWDDWREAAFGWQLVVPYPKYATYRHRPRASRSDPASKKRLVKTQSDFSGLTEDSFDSVFCSWKESVEPVTYCYMPNNGWYRNNKPGPTKLTKEVQEWLEVMQSSKSAQSMLVRQLRKAAEIAQKSEPGASRVGIYEGEIQAAAEARTQDEESNKNRHSIFPWGKQKDRTTEVLQFAAKRLQYQAQLNSSAYSSKTGDSAHFLTSHTDPRTTCDSSISRKSSELSLHNHFPANFNEKRQLTDAYMPNTTRLAIQTKNHQRYEEDLFMFIPVCKQEALRPLPKLICRQKETEDNNSDPAALSPRTDSQREKGPAALQMDPATTVVPATATVFPAEENSGGLRTARSAITKTNLRIEEMRNAPLRSSQPSGKARSFFAHKGSGLALLKNGVLRYTVTK